MQRGWASGHDCPPVAPHLSNRPWHGAGGPLVLKSTHFRFAVDLFPVGPGAEGTAPFRPACDAGVALPPSTSLKWAHDGELTALDLHHVLARLCLHDPQACRALHDGDAALP
jgi:hypothetical protein